MLSVSEFSSQIRLAVKRYILNSSSSLIFKVVSLCEGFNILEKKRLYTNSDFRNYYFKVVLHLFTLVNI